MEHSAPMLPTPGDQPLGREHLKCLDSPRQQRSLEPEIETTAISTVERSGPYPTIIRTRISDLCRIRLDFAGEHHSFKLEDPPPDDQVRVVDSRGYSTGRLYLQTRRHRLPTGTPVGRLSGSRRSDRPDLWPTRRYEKFHSPSRQNLTKLHVRITVLLPSSPILIELNDTVHHVSGQTEGLVNAFIPSLTWDYLRGKKLID